MLGKPARALTDEAHHPGEATLDLVKVDGGQHSQRHHDGYRQADLLGGPDDCRPCSRRPG